MALPSLHFRGGTHDVPDTKVYHPSTSSSTIVCLSGTTLPLALAGVCQLLLEASTTFMMKTFILTLALPLAGNIFALASDPSTVKWLTPTTTHKTPKHLPTEAACNKKLYCGDKGASCGYDLCGCAACCPDNAVCTGCIKSMIYVCVYLSSANMSTDYRTEPWSSQQLPRDHSNHQTRR